MGQDLWSIHVQKQQRISQTTERQPCLSLTTQLRNYTQFLKHRQICLHLFFPNLISKVPQWDIFFTFFNHKRWQVTITFIEQENWWLPWKQGIRHHSTMLSGANASYLIFINTCSKMWTPCGTQQSYLVPSDMQANNYVLTQTRYFGCGHIKLMSMTQPWLITWIIQHGWYLETPYAAFYTLSAAPLWKYRQICPEIDMNYNVNVYDCKSMYLATGLRGKSYRLLEVPKGYTE